MKFFWGLIIFQLVLISCGESKKKTEKVNTWQYVSATDKSKPVARHEAAFVGVKDKFYWFQIRV